MTWGVQRQNVAADEIVTSPESYPSAEAAFRAAMESAVSDVIEHWDAGAIPNIDGPADSGRFKIYIDRRPGRAEVELRYDYPDMWDQETNSIFWRVVEG